jgi:D-glycero-D-manno-heptose 1,7-bisphosphate phosphatase
VNVGAGAPERAIFLDRDGTLIEDRQYIGRPDDVHLLPGAADGVRELRALAYRIVVVTNQSGIARGMFTDADYERVRERLETLLAREGARVDATYHCPHHPDFTGVCRCRKPETELYERAAADLHLDLSRSIYIGDRWRDVAPSLRFGGRGILVPSRATPDDELAKAAESARDLNEVVKRLRSG